MNRKEFLHYFKQKELASDTNNKKEITVTKMDTSSTNDISNAKLTLVKEEIQKYVKISAKYQNKK